MDPVFVVTLGDLFGLLLFAAFLVFAMVFALFELGKSLIRRLNKHDGSGPTQGS